MSTVYLKDLQIGNSSYTWPTTSTSSNSTYSGGSIWQVTTNSSSSYTYDDFDSTVWVNPEKIQFTFSFDHEDLYITDLDKTYTIKNYYEKIKIFAKAEQLAKFNPRIEELINELTILVKLTDDTEDEINSEEAQ